MESSILFGAMVLPTFPSPPLEAVEATERTQSIITKTFIAAKLVHASNECEKLIDQNSGEWRNCAHQVQDGNSSLVDLTFETHTPNVTDSGISRRLSIEHSKLFIDNSVITIPSSRVKLVYSECSAWHCVSAKRVSGKIYVTRANDEVAFQIDLRAELPRERSSPVTYSRVFEWVKARLPMPSGSN